MAKRQNGPKAAAKIDPMVAAALTGVIYQAKLFNRQARVSVPEEEIMLEVVSLWRSVMHTAGSITLPEMSA